jgi:16S rRNA (adenine1518-N6/adenine1519-N6)-dimethyltransferase
VLERIAAAACGESERLVVEIGPGRGALTARLLERASRVVAIEVDAGLAGHLREKFAGDPRLEVVHADVLTTDLAQWGPAVVAGNLPYYATSPILEKITALGPLARRAVLLIQKEVAERVAARPGSREYGYLSVAVQLFAAVRVLFEVKPAAFHPPPKVDSAVVRLDPHDRAAELGIGDTRAFLEFVGCCFRQKRKTLRNNLAAAYGRDAIDVIDTWPEAPLRAEQVPLETFAEMYRRLLSWPRRTP